jgi:C4-dicarboxylate-specific signal transduction histidine kinase
MDTLHILGIRVAKEKERARRRAKKRLAEARERLALLSSTQSFGFWSWNRATDVACASKCARRILGLDARTPLTRDLLVATIHPSDRDKITRTIGATTSHNDTVEMELRVVGQGMHHWITTKARAYRDANGAILRVVGYVVDESKDKRAEARRIQQQQQIAHLARVAMLGQLSGAIAHELQQPLAAILYNAEAAQLLAASADFKVDDLREILCAIINDNQHAGQVIQRLRSLLMRGELKIQRVEIGDLVGKALALCRGTLTKRCVQVDLRIDAGLPPIQGDHVELQQVLLNLILNASESMCDSAPSDRRIEIDVRLDVERQTVRTSVLDCGKGIKEDQLERVFEPFFTTKVSGMGLGLAVSQAIVVAHKGRLWATRRSGAGAAFHFTLPLAPMMESEERCNGTTLVVDGRQPHNPFPIGYKAHAPSALGLALQGRPG